jgi:uncharacterized membrane protein
MTKGRLEAFSDAVIAIIMTIMVLELKAPASDAFEALHHEWPVFVAYVLSFLYLAIYWNNHHHMLHASKHVTGGVLWANMHLLFWLSLVPFGTAWLGEHPFSPGPVAVYGVLLLMAAISYTVLQYVLVRVNGKESALAKALGNDLKGKASVVLYAVAVGLSFVAPMISCILYAVVALIWLVPDRRIESKLAD